MTELSNGDSEKMLRFRRVLAMEMEMENLMMQWYNDWPDDGYLYVADIGQITIEFSSSRQKWYIY